METSLIINDREYIPLKVAADLIGCGETYIDQLVHGKWVEASSVHGVQYIDVEALLRFMRLLEEEQTANTNVRIGLDHLAAMSQQEDQGDDSGWVVLSKTGVVVLGGLLVGVLIVAAIENDLTLAQLRSSLLASTALLLQMFAW